jgi:hypothetical protein
MNELDKNIIQTYICPFLTLCDISCCARVSSTWNDIFTANEALNHLRMRVSRAIPCLDWHMNHKKGKKRKFSGVWRTLRMISGLCRLTKVRKWIWWGDGPENRVEIIGHIFGMNLPAGTNTKVVRWEKHASHITLCYENELMINVLYRGRFNLNQLLLFWRLLYK